ncbi:MAG TPA: hypothetical protein VJM07_10930 [Gaiella sp.]|nr:hypothetical protein [Gaiella sp.]
MRPRLLPLALAAALALVVAPAAAADLADETALAEKYAPVVRLVEQLEECGPGEPYEPMDVDALFGDPTVALRGPWNAFDLVKIGPTADDLARLFEYHLDFPGSALEPGCTYELWARRLTEGDEPAVYAHVATEPGAPGKLALQYWFFYAFNDFNNTHEGDWEMIQLVFDAAGAEEAIGEPPVEVGYSSHEGAERAAWDDDKLELVDETHPVVFPAAGSHANKFTDALYLGSSAEAGVGCDDTRGPHREIRPTVITIPSDPGAAADAFGWITFEGRWGELQKAFFNGPTGPNMKTQWTTPMEWAEDWRDRSYAVPTGGVLGTGATDFFCTGVERGSEALSALLRSPTATFLVIAALLGLLAFVVIKATWTPVAARRIARRRTWGQTLSSSASMYVKQPRLFLGVGLLLIPTMLVITVIQWLLISGIDLLGSVTGNLAGLFAYLALVVGTTLALLGLALVMAATACALVELDAGRPVGATDAYRLALRRIRPLLRAVALFVAMWVLLTSTGFLIPLAVWLAVKWSLLAPVVELEDRGGQGALRRSAELVRGRWLRVGSLVGLSALVALVAGPLLGALLIFVSDTSLVVLNLVAGVVYAIALPFVALVTCYVYFDARARHELEPEERPDELPAEIVLERG